MSTRGVMIGLALQEWLYSRRYYQVSEVFRKVGSLELYTVGVLFCVKESPIDCLFFFVLLGGVKTYGILGG